MTLDLKRNPFFVLELEADAAVVEIERQGKRLLAELELGREKARTYTSPFGVQPRDEGAVRSAIAALRDPRLREVYAAFAPPRESWAPPSSGADAAPAAPYPELRDAVPGAPPWLRRLFRAPA